MYSEDAYCGLFLTIPGSGHVPQQGVGKHFRFCVNFVNHYRRIHYRRRP
jgi:hypothetical protein